jgi:ribonuclease HII
MESSGRKRIYRCSYRFEKKLFSQGFSRIAGVDEVGRGALCGPVVAAAVMFSQRPKIRGINDSKQLPSEKREKLKPKILKASLAFGVGIVSAEEIDRINIHQATLKAMRIALDQLVPSPDFILVDGTRVHGLKAASLNLIKGDARCLTIAAASIIAKVTRDNLLQSYASMYPMYDWAHNKGYSCVNHFKGLAEFGPVTFHRRSFRPVQVDGQLSLLDTDEFITEITAF